MRRRVSRVLAPDVNLGAVIVLLLALIAFFTLVSASTFATGPNASNLLRQASFDAVMALGLMVVMIAGGLDISIGAVMSMSAALVMGLQSHGVVPAIAVAIAFGCAVGLVNGIMVVRLGIVPFVATLGTMTIVGGMVHAYTDSKPIPGHSEAFTALGSDSIGFLPVPAVIMAVIALATGYVLKYTRAGRSTYAIGGNMDAAALAGIKIGRALIGTYVFSGACAATAGVLTAAALNTSSTQLGIDTPLFVLSAVIIGGASIFGGRGSAIGAVLGVLALTVLSNGMNGLGTPSAHQVVIKAGVFIVVVVVDALSVRLLKPQRLRNRAAAAEVPA
jgi:ribose transport system permease protein